jgi:hypothetical protein
MPEGAHAYPREGNHASYPVALLKRQYRDVEELFSRIGESENVTERRRLLELIIQKLTLRRVLTVLLKNDRPLCARCLAHYGRMALGQAATMLDNLRQVIAVSVQLGECLACREFTRTFFLAKTHSGSTQGTAS